MQKHLSQRQIDEIRRRREAGEKAKRIAQEMDIAVSTVTAHTIDIVNRKKAQRVRARIALDEMQPCDASCPESYPERERLVHELCMLTARMRKELTPEKQRDPCLHCRWRLNGQPVRVCIGYCGRMDRRPGSDE